LLCFVGAGWLALVCPFIQKSQAFVVFGGWYFELATIIYIASTNRGDSSGGSPYLHGSSQPDCCKHAHKQLLVQ
jgi:hypothetical protein